MMHFTPDFIEKAILLGITAVLSGFLIPFILKRIDERKAAAQKEKEAMLSRQSKIIDAQSEFFKTISKLLWDWRYLLIKVTYYGGANNADQFAAASDEYDTNIWDLLNKIRYQTSLSRSLISETIYQQLLAWYLEIINLDKQLQAILRKKDPIKRELDLADLNSQLFKEVTAKIDELINKIANDVSLSVNIQKENQ